MLMLMKAYAHQGFACASFFSATLLLNMSRGVGRGTHVFFKGAPSHSLIDNHGVRNHQKPEG